MVEDSFLLAHERDIPEIDSEGLSGWVGVDDADVGCNFDKMRVHRFFIALIVFGSPELLLELIFFRVLRVHVLAGVIAVLMF